MKLTPARSIRRLVPAAAVAAVLVSACSGEDGAFSSDGQDLRSRSSTCVEVQEHQTATLSCPGQTIASVGFASYGLPAGTCGSFSTSSCNAASALDVVKAACVGKSSCTVSATNDVFGDPCVGTLKSLAIQVTCSGGSSGSDAGTPPTGTGGGGTDAGTTTTPPPPPPPSGGSCAPAPTSSTVVSVKDTGAKGDGNTDDTAAIQAAVNQVAGTGGTVLVPAGTYKVNTSKGISLGSKMTFRMDSAAVIQATASSSSTYNIIVVQGKTDVNIIGGTVIGDRAIHTGSGGEWGMGISLSGGSRIVVEGVTSKNMWGDGFYLAGGVTAAQLCSVVGDNNRRQGVSLVAASNIVIKDSIFKNTNGTNPQAGIDLEPNSGSSVTGVTISDCQMLNNTGRGIELWAAAGGVSNITMSDNQMSGNDGDIEFYKTSKSIADHNTLKDARDYAIKVWGGSTGNTISNNDITVTGNASGHGIIMSDSGNTSTGNVIH